MTSIDEKVERIDKLLFQGYEEFRNMDKNLILTAIKPRTYQRLEILGDAVLELIVKRVLFKYSNLDEGNIATYASRLVRNVSLYCMNLHKGYAKSFIHMD